MEKKKIPAVKLRQVQEDQVKGIECIGVDGKKIIFPDKLAWANYVVAHCENLDEILGRKK